MVFIYRDCEKAKYRYVILIKISVLLLLLLQVLIYWPSTDIRMIEFIRHIDRAEQRKKNMCFMSFFFLYHSIEIVISNRYVTHFTLNTNRILADMNMMLFHEFGHSFYSQFILIFMKSIEKIGTLYNLYYFLENTSKKWATTHIDTSLGNYFKISKLCC